MANLNKGQARPALTGAPGSYSAWLLALCGLVLLGLGIYFALLRPALLPEDLRYMDTSIAGVQATVPGLAGWLDKVFWVMGGYIAATGVLTLHLALTAFRRRERAAGIAAVLAGVSSVGVMTAVNFLLGSDFRWLLLLFAGLWTLAVVLFAGRK